MLFAVSSLELGGGALSSGLLLERWFSAHSVVKRRLCYDTALSPPVRRARDVATVYLVSAGTMADSRGRSHSGHSAWVLTEAEFERPGPGATTFRSWGDPSVSMNLRLHVKYLRGPVGMEHGPRPLSAASWERFAAFTEATAPGRDPRVVDQSLRPLLEQLSRDGVLAPELPAVVPYAAEAPSLIRIWEQLAAAFANFELRMTLDELSARSGLSARQIRRDLWELAQTFELPGGFRDGLTVMRLRAALALLSAPEATVSEVAARIGYGSVDALGRAFRDARLPSPIEVRQRLRASGGEPR